MFPTLWILLAVFLTRHCLIAFLNAGMTALLGLGILRGAQRFGWPCLSTFTRLRLRRLVLLCALTKGAFYLLRGTAVRNSGVTPYGFGIQFPGPEQWVGLAPMSTLNIWKPTPATDWVMTILVSGGLILLVRRLRQLLVSQRSLTALLFLTSDPQAPRFQTLLLQAAQAMQWPIRVSLPQIVLVELPQRSPLLLGLGRPLLLFSPRLAAELSDLEVEVVLRHELAHCLRSDQWWRWVQAYLEDVGRLSGLSRLLGTQAIALEEEMCDRMAVRTAVQAAALARALHKVAHPASSSPDNAASPDSTVALPSSIVPAFWGDAQFWKDPTLLSNRLEALLEYAQELSAAHSTHPAVESAVPAPGHFGRAGRLVWRVAAHALQTFGLVCLALILLLILYAKFNAVIGY